MAKKRKNEYSDTKEDVFLKLNKPKMNQSALALFFDSVYRIAPIKNRKLFLREWLERSKFGEDGEKHFDAWAAKKRWE